MKNRFACIFIIITSTMAAQQANSIKVEIKSIGDQINSSSWDYTPLITADASMMLFTSRRPVSKHEILKQKDLIYHSNFDFKTMEWLDGIPFSKKINASFKNNRAAAISNDGQQMLIIREDGDGNGDIYETHLSGWEWSEPVSLGPPINTIYDESSASITPDGKIIFFVSNRPDGLGGYDIWYCAKKDNGKWGPAVNLGDPINSKYDEVSVFFHPDGKTLFFSSNKPGSLGGFDVYMSVFDRTTITWSKHVNLGLSINSPEDDLNFVMEADGKIGYYSSIRLGGLGGKDIYRVKFFEDIMKPDLIVLKGRVIDSKGNAIESKIVIKDKSTDKITGIFASNSSTGKYVVSLPAGKNYSIAFTADDYSEFDDSFDISAKTGYEEVSKDVILKSNRIIPEPLKR